MHAQLLLLWHLEPQHDYTVGLRLHLSSCLPAAECSLGLMHPSGWCWFNTLGDSPDLAPHAVVQRSRCAAAASTAGQGT
jgi:hypothetical protein